MSAGFETARKIQKKKKKEIFHPHTRELQITVEKIKTIWDGKLWLCLNYYFFL